MSIHKQPAVNPFAERAQASARGAALDQGLGSRSRAYRGISRLATEQRLQVISMRRATLLSTALHVASPVVMTALVLAVLLLLSWLLHFNLWDWLKPKSKPADIEFSLVNDTQATRPDNPMFKGNFNQRAGGEQDPNQPLKPLEDQQLSQARKAEAASEPAPQTPPSPKPAPVQPQETPTPPQPRPVSKAPVPPAPQPKTKPAVATPKAPEPMNDPVADGPVASTQAANAAAGPVASAITSLGEAFAGAVGSASSTGNPQTGEAGKPGVDVAQDIDFGPFMADLERRIKRNWTPPRGAESRRVMLLFYLARDGRVVKIETKEPSGDEDADRAAIAAVEASAPFMPFPPQVKEDILPVEFTFDYNVLNPKKR